MESRANRQHTWRGFFRFLFSTIIPYAVPCWGHFGWTYLVCPSKGHNILATSLMTHFTPTHGLRSTYITSTPQQALIGWTTIIISACPSRVPTKQGCRNIGFVDFATHDRILKCRASGKARPASHEKKCCTPAFLERELCSCSKGVDHHHGLESNRRFNPKLKTRWVKTEYRKHFFRWQHILRAQSSLGEKFGNYTNVEGSAALPETQPREVYSFNSASQVSSNRHSINASVRTSEY